MRGQPGIAGAGWMAVREAEVILAREVRSVDASSFADGDGLRAEADGEAGAGRWRQAPVGKVAGHPPMRGGAGGRDADEGAVQSFATPKAVLRGRGDDEDFTILPIHDEERADGLPLCHHLDGLLIEDSNVT